jgi:hypothetical protein
MGDDPRSKAVPANLYYLAIDGTWAIDSVTYGELLENEFGWKNLVGHFLEARPDDATLLLDPAHRFLPICLYKAKTPSKSVAVVCPGGRESVGKDSIWKAYAGEFPHEAPNGRVRWAQFGNGETFGRHTAALRSAMFMQSLIRDPAIELNRRDGKLLPQLTDLDHPDRIQPPESDVYRADLLIVSSHGWLGGYMRGNLIPAWPEAEPEAARPELVPPLPLYAVGEAAEKRQGFFGPRWIILAQCSTVNKSTWPLWAAVLARSHPAVRGILAYEEVSPGPDESAAVARAFVAGLKLKKSMLQSWIDANQGQKWAAIVHKEAREDRIAAWRSFKEPSSVTTTGDSGAYEGYLRSVPRGEEIRLVPPPFDCAVSSTDPSQQPDIQQPPPAGARWDEVTPASLFRARARLDQQWYQVAVTPRGGAKAVAVTLRWIHLRTTYSKQPLPSQLFQQIRALPGEESAVEVKLSGHDIRVRRVAGDGPGLAVLHLGRPGVEYPKIGLEMHHAYVWLQVDLQLATGTTLRHEFMTNGLTF